MADVSLVNSASVSGTYNLSPLSIQSNTVITKIVSGLTVKKEVDKQEWVEGNLTYTITIQNNAENSFVSPVLVDVLDPNLVKLEANSVQVNGVNTNYTYEEASGRLSINLEEITVGGTSVITFRVQQKS